MKRVLAVILGAALAIAIVAGVDWINILLFPLSVDLESADPASLSRIIYGMPLPAKLLTTLPWFLAPLCGAWLALRVCDWRPAGWVVSVLLLAATLINVASLPHPMWMQVCALLLPLLGGWLAQRLHRKPYPGEPLLG